MEVRRLSDGPIIGYFTVTFLWLAKGTYFLLLFHSSGLFGGLLDYARPEPSKLVNLKYHMLGFLRGCLKLYYHTAAVEAK